MKRVFLSFYLFIVAIFVILQFGFGPMMENIILKVMRKDLDVYYRELAQGFFYIMDKDLRETDEARLPDLLSECQARFKFPLFLHPLQSSYFSREEANELTQGLIVSRGYGDLFYQRIGNSIQVLQVGPLADIPSSHSIDIKTKVIVYSVAIIFLSLLALFWAFPFWKKLKRIRAAAQSFGRGDFGTRITIQRTSSLAPVAAAFNSMADRIEQLIDSSRELIRAVSHELRTPVSRIRFHLEMAGSAVEKTERLRHMEGIHKDIDELDALISELITYVRFETESRYLSTEAYPLVPWLNEIVAYMEVELEGIAFCLHNSLGPGAESACFDLKHMGRAATNLLRNAAKCCRGRIDLTVTAENGTICLQVDDDGPGIPEKDRERVFDPFTRLDDSRSRDSGGHGIGLAIVKRVAQWHHEEVTVTDSHLGGARFSIRWHGSNPVDILRLEQL